MTMNKKLIIAMMAFSAAALPAMCAAPDWVKGAPRNLTVTPDGSDLLLTWDWSVPANPTYEYGFEGDSFLPQGWEIRSSDNATETSTWFRYPDYFTGEGDEFLLHSGSCSAMIAMHDENLPQNEWLVMKAPANAQYLEFWSFIPPEVVEFGADPDFPDHYYVKISRDGGETWNILWDGRHDLDQCDVMQQVSLFLGETTDENTLVAFQALSSEEESLYGIWAIDDICFSSISETGESSGQVARHNPARTPEATEGYYFIVFRDGEQVTDELGRRFWRDTEQKAAGTYEYEVCVMDIAAYEMFESAKTEYTISDEPVPAPADLRADVTFHEDTGRYDISLSWNKPDGRDPIYYNVFGDGARIGYELEETGMGQTGLYKGVYSYEVIAEYANPLGTSDPARVTVACGTSYPPENVRVENGTLLWDKPAGPSSPTGYDVYRGNEKLKESTTEMTLPLNGKLNEKCRYSVHAVYADGTRSLPAYIDAGEPATHALPLVENFDGGHLPAGWSVEKGFDAVKSVYLWRFDNWYGIDAPAAFSGEFASISSEVIPGADMCGMLVTPTIDCTNTDEIAVMFDLFYTSPRMLSLCALDLQVSTDGGETWETAYSFKEDTDGSQNIDISQYAAGHKAQIRWYYRDRFAKYAAIDNVAITDDPSGVDGIIEDKPDSAAVYYTLQGIRVDNPSNGIYIKISGGKSCKVVVK